MDEITGVYAGVLSLQRFLILALIAITTLGFPIIASIYYHRRRHPILRARRPEWALLNQFMVCSVIVCYGYDSWRHYPTCSQILFTNSVLSMLTLDSHIIRCWLLLYNWNASKALCSQKAGESFTNSNWWLRNTHLASNSVTATVMAGLTASHLGFWLLFCAINGWDKSWSQPAENAICTSPLLWFFGVWGALACQMAIATYLAYNMRLVVDAFQIRKELMTSGGIWVVGCMIFWLLALLFPNLERIPNYIIMTGLSVQICGIVVLYINLVKPLLMVWEEAKNKIGFEMTTMATDMGDGAVQWTPGPIRAGYDLSAKVQLRQMLDMNTGISSAFIEFLAKEFSVENWKFYSDVLQLRKTYGGWNPDHAGCSGLKCGHLDWFRVQAPGLMELENGINRIYTSYLSNTAPFAINLGSDRMQALQACFGPDNLLRPQRIDDIPELLCRAQDEIYELMRADSYERFKRTREFDQAQLALV